MSKEYMDMIYEWSKKVCPKAKFEKLLEDLATLTPVIEHLKYNAFGSTGHCLDKVSRLAVTLQDCTHRNVINLTEIPKTAICSTSTSSSMVSINEEDPL